MTRIPRSVVLTKGKCACGCGERVKPRNNKGLRRGLRYVSGHGPYRRYTQERLQA